eukprot:Sspe_Gene.2175::Locus_716_Transcript_3_3_Confidence_0.667_Length_1558::g.2175::m.2175
MRSRRRKRRTSLRRTEARPRRSPRRTSCPTRDTSRCWRRSCRGREQEKEERIKEMEFRKQLLEAEHALRSIEVEIDKIRAEWEEEAFEPVLGSATSQTPW